MIRALLLDVDDTLIDTGAAMVRAGTGVVQRLWPELDRDGAAAFAAHFRNDPEGDFARFTRGELTFDVMRRRRFEASRAAFGLSSTPGDFDRFEEDYQPALRAELSAFDDVEPLLEWAGGAGLPVGLLTNSAGEATARKLAGVGLAGRFACVVTTDTLGVGKPDRRVFHHACALLAVDPAEVLHVGDDPVVDVEGARAAGLSALLLDRHRPTGAPSVDGVVSSLLAIETTGLMASARSRILGVDR